MNVTSAYSQLQGVFRGQETQRTTAVADKVHPVLTSGGDTVSISPEAQALAKTPVFDLSSDPRVKERIEAMKAGLEDGSVKLKMFNDPSLTEADVIFFPEALAARMPKLSEMPQLADTDRLIKGLMSNEETASYRQGMNNYFAASQYASRAASAYLEAMRQAGLDGLDPDALLKFSKDAERLKAVDDIFLKILGEV